MTAQRGEKLFVNPWTMASMNYFPLLPEHHPGIIERTSAEFEDSDAEAFSTDCWRRYIGTWRITDGCLYLAEIRGRYKIVGDEQILADWVSGEIGYSEGKLLSYVHMGFESVYEYEVLIEFKNGKLIDSRLIDSSGKEVNDEELTMQYLYWLRNRFDGYDKM